MPISRVIGAVASALLFILLNAGAASPENPLELSVTNQSSKPVDFYIDRSLQCRIPVGYGCRIKISRGVHTVRMVRPDKKAFNDTFMLPELRGGKEHDAAGYFVKDDRVDYLLVVPKH